MEITLEKRSSYDLVLRVDNDTYLLMLYDWHWKRIDVMPGEDGYTIAVNRYRIENALSYIERNWDMAGTVFKLGHEKMARLIVEQVLSKYKMSWKRVLIL